MGDEEVADEFGQIGSKIAIARHEQERRRVRKVDRNHEEHVAEPVGRHLSGCVEIDAGV